MTENVILLGAGASHAAGIPLLGNFMERIWELAKTGVAVHRELTDDEVKLLLRAVEIKNSMREYHAQVAFDQFNIEDILSILSFDVLAGSKQGREQLDDFTRAISLTIELSCEVGHHGKLNSMCDQGPEQFRAFWKGLFGAMKRDLLGMPAIISFNYDLVLERALLQTIIGWPLKGYREFIRGRRLLIRYDHKNCDAVEYDLKSGDYGMGPDAKHGLYLEVPKKVEAKVPSIIEIPIIKPHGSLNFPKQSRDSEWSIVKAVPDPAILPPVFNKASVEIGAPIWKAGMEALRNCKNLIICGYSLPTTDTYMQYFLKSALGPNPDLNRIFVFDPVLFEDGRGGEALKERYSKYFSPQFQKRIQFTPDSDGIKPKKLGTFEHFAELLEKRPEALLFGVSPENPSDNGHTGFRPSPKRRTRGAHGL